MEEALFVDDGLLILITFVPGTHRIVDELENEATPCKFARTTTTLEPAFIIFLFFFSFSSPFLFSHRMNLQQEGYDVLVAQDIQA